MTRRDVLVKAGAVGMAVSVSGVLAACGKGGHFASGGASGAASSTEIDHIDWGIVGNPPDSLFIANSFSESGVLGGFLGLEGLLRSDENLHLQPALAESWAQPHLLRYEFELRPDARFWDGSPVTVDDAVYSIARNLDPKSASQIGFFYLNVAAVEAVGRSTIAIIASNPDPTIPQVMTFTPILPRGFLEELGPKVGTPGGKNGNLMGSGPYVIESFSLESGLEVSRNPDYWGEKPRVKSASITYIPSPETMLLAARSGSIDGGFQFPLSDAANWSRVPGIATDFIKETGLSLNTLSFDLESEPWDDIHVRRAVAHCCDTAGYANAYLGREAEPATCLVPPAQWAGVADPAEVKALYATLRQYPFDIEAAKAELAQSSHPDGFEANVVVPSTAARTQGKALVNLSEELKQLGIKLNVELVPEPQWYAQVNAHKDLGIQIIKYSPDYADPSDYIAVFELSANAVEYGYNLANVKNPTIDRLLQEQAETKDNEKRTALLGEALKISNEEVAYMPLWWEGPTVAIKTDYVYNGLNGLYYYQPWLNNIGVRA